MERGSGDGVYVCEMAELWQVIYSAVFLVFSILLFDVNWQSQDSLTDVSTSHSPHVSTSCNISLSHSVKG